MKFSKKKQDKLKYVVLTILVVLLTILIYCCYIKKTNEPFVNESNKLDVLLGKNSKDEIRSSLTQDVNYNNLKIVYSTYQTSNALNDNLFFIRYTPSQKNNKIIGDLVNIYSISENTFINEKDIIDSVISENNIPQLLNPIINENQNAVILTTNDVKDNIIITNSNDTKTNKLLKFMNYDPNYYNFDKIYEFYNGDKMDSNYNQLSTNQKLNSSQYITYDNERVNISIKTVKYNDLIKILYEEKNNEIDIEKHIIKVIRESISNLNNLLGINNENKNKNENIKYIPAGFSYNFNQKKILFNFLNDDLEVIDEYNKNNYLKNLFDKPLSDNISIFFTEISFFENTKNEIKIENYPVLVINNEINDSLPKIQPNYVESLITRYKSDIDAVKNRYLNYYKELKFLSNKNTKLNIPLKIIRFNDKDDEHIIFGDAITTNILKDDKNLLSNYIKLPKRCCKLYEDGITYQDLQPIYTFTNLDDEVIEIYQHPIYSTFRAFKSTEDKNVQLYEIIPCAQQITKYQDKIEKYQKLKKKCLKLQSSNQKVLVKDNSFNNLQIKTKLEDIHENEKMINELRKQTTVLERNINKKDVINRAYNRNKLQNYNDKLYSNLYKGYKNLNTKSIGLNLKYTDKVIKHLIDKCRNNQISLCNNSSIEQNKIEQTNKKNYLIDLLNNLLNSKISQQEKDVQLNRIIKKHTCN